MIASASSSIDIPSGAPAWRVMVGNLAAGATAGCAVEAGESALPVATVCWDDSPHHATAARQWPHKNLNAKELLDNGGGMFGQAWAGAVVP